MGFEKWVQMLMRKNIRSPLRTRYQHNMPRGFLRRRRLVSNTDRFVGGTRMAHVRVGSRLCLDFVAVETNCTGNFCRKKANEKTILGILGSRTFSHSLGHSRRFGDVRVSSAFPLIADV